MRKLGEHLQVSETSRANPVQRQSTYNKGVRSTQICPCDSHRENWLIQVEFVFDTCSLWQTAARGRNTQICLCDSRQENCLICIWLVTYVTSQIHVFKSRAPNHMSSSSSVGRQIICVEVQVSGAKSYVFKFKSRAPNGTHVILTRNICSIWRPRLQLLHLPTTTSAHTYTHVTLAERIDVVVGWCRNWSFERKIGHDTWEKHTQMYIRLSPRILTPFVFDTCSIRQMGRYTWESTQKPPGKPLCCSFALTMMIAFEIRVRIENWLWVSQGCGDGNWPFFNVTLGKLM